MPVRAINRIYDTSNPPVEIGIEIIGAGRDVLPSGEIGMRILYSDIPGNSWNQNRLNQFTQRAQALIDQRMARAALAADDPARLADPARLDFFWSGTDIVARSVLISDVSWDGSRLNFRLTRVR